MGHFSDLARMINGHSTEMLNNELNANIRAKDSIEEDFGDSLLYKAAMEYNIEAAQILMQHNININDRNQERQLRSL